MAPSRSPAWWSSSARANRRSKSWDCWVWARTGMRRGAVRRAASGTTYRRDGRRYLAHADAGARCDEQVTVAGRRRTARRHQAENSARGDRTGSPPRVDPGRTPGFSRHLEVILQDELDHAVAALQVDLPEVVLRLRREVEPAGRIADVVDEGARRRRGCRCTRTLQLVSSVRLMSLPS